MRVRSTVGVIAVGLALLVPVGLPAAAGPEVWNILPPGQSGTTGAVTGTFTTTEPFAVRLELDRLV